jgi:hypothetical protein
MKTEENGAASEMIGDAVMRTFVRGRIASEPEFAQTMEGVGVCRLLVIGEAGPASRPPRVSLYVRDGGDLRADEAKRCAFNLRPGDLIQAVGDIGAERAKAARQEIVVSEPVRLRARAGGEAGAA